MDVDELLDAFREITAVENHHDIVEDGLYKGCIIRYKSGCELFHPYVPLTISGVIVDPDTLESSVTLITRYGLVGGSRLVDGYPLYEDVLLARAKNNGN
jgi:hypothetical protein